MDGKESKTDACLDATPTNISVANSSSFVHGTNDRIEETGARRSGQQRAPPVALDMYNMTGKKYLYVFNHFKYEKNSYYPKPEELQRDGTLEDAITLTRTFTNLGFKTTVHLDKPHDYILKEMAKVWNMDHSSTSCVVVVIMTHGHNGGVLLASDKPYYLKELTDMLDDCHPSLDGKPKLFFVQACRSGHVDNGIPVMPDAGQNIVRPKQDHMLIMYSSYPHFVSYRFPGYGTWMIQHLCEILMKYRQNFNLLQMLTFVNQAVANEVYKQMPETEHRLKKELKL